MLLKPISINYQHQVALELYLDMITTTIKDITNNDSKFKNFIDVCNIIIEHHNSYRNDILEIGNYNDFLSIIPTHFTAMVNGYLTGLEQEDNRSLVRIYKQLLSEEAYKYIDKVRNLEIEKDI